MFVMLTREWYLDRARECSGDNFGRSEADSRETDAGFRVGTAAV